VNDINSNGEALVISFSIFFSKNTTVSSARFMRFLPESGSEEDRQTLQSAQKLFTVYSTAQNLRNNSFYGR